MLIRKHIKQKKRSHHGYYDEEDGFLVYMPTEQETGKSAHHNSVQERRNSIRISPHIDKSRLKEAENEICLINQI